MRRSSSIVVALLLSLAVASPAEAEPQFQFAKPEAPPPPPEATEPPVIWKSTVSAGLILTSGNSNNVSFATTANASRNDGKNRVVLDVGGAYAQATNEQADDVNANGTIDGPEEVKRVSQTSTALWNTKLRYDRFFTTNNVGYLTGFANGNEPAGKRVVAGAQIGYSRQLYQSQRNLLVGELGYDYSFERLVAPGTADFHLHSLRAFFSYALTLSEVVGLGAEVEYLGTMNPFKGPTGADVGSFQDSRVNGKASINAKLWKWLSFRFGLTVRFDNVPALRPALGLPYAMGFTPSADKVDTITDASLVFTLL